MQVQNLHFDANLHLLFATQMSLSILETAAAIVIIICKSCNLCWQLEQFLKLAPKKCKLKNCTTKSKLRNCTLTKFAPVFCNTNVTQYSTNCSGSWAQPTFPLHPHLTAHSMPHGWQPQCMNWSKSEVGLRYANPTTVPFQ